jgi:hypothetical protein
VTYTHDTSRPCHLASQLQTTPAICSKELRVRVAALIVTCIASQQLPCWSHGTAYIATETAGLRWRLAFNRHAAVQSLGTFTVLHCIPLAFHVKPYLKSCLSRRPPQACALQDVLAGQMSCLEEVEATVSALKGQVAVAQKLRRTRKELLRNQHNRWARFDCWPNFKGLSPVTASQGLEGFTFLVVQPANNQSMLAVLRS